MKDFKYYRAVQSKALEHQAPLLYERSTRFSRVFNIRKLSERKIQQSEVVQAIKEDAYNLLRSGYIEEEQYYDYISSIPSVTKPTVAQLANISAYRAEMWNRYYDKNKRKIEVFMTNQYLMSDLWYYFKNFAPEASKVIERLAMVSPYQFSQLLDDGKLPTEWNVSDWDNITASVLNEWDLYDSDEQESKVLSELDRWEEIVSEKRPWAKK